MKPYVLCAVLVVLLGTCASASRGWDNPFLASKDGPQLMKAGGSSARAVSADNHHDKGSEYFDRRAFVGIRYKIPPSLHDDFIKAWRKMEADVAKESHVDYYGLTKTMQDNHEFVTYGEWKTMMDYMDHYHSKHTRQFLDFLADNNLTWDMYPLKNVTSIKDEMRGRRIVPSMRSDAEEEGRKEQKMAHIMFHYHMEPCVKDDFIKAWEECAKDAWKDKGNVMYSLRKVTTNNHHFLGWGMWDSYDDFMDHLDSKHLKHFKKFCEKNDVLWYFDPVFQLGKEFKVE